MSGRREYRLSFFRAWDALLVGFVVVLAVLGVDILLSIQWQPRVVAIPDGEAFYYPWRAVWLVAFAGGLLVAVGFLIGTERQFHNWLFVAVGLGLISLGTTYVATEHVTVTEKGFTARRWWGLESHGRNYDELESLTVVTHQGRKGAYWITVRCQQKRNGDAAPGEEFDVPRLMFACQSTLRRHAMAKGVAVTAVTASP